MHSSTQHLTHPRRHAGALAGWLPGIFATVAAIAIVASPLALHAAEPPEGEDVPGELIIRTPFEFVRFVVDGKATWENHEYIDKRKTLVILGLDRDEEHSVVLTPRESGYAPVTLMIKPEDFKRAMIKKAGKRIAVYRAAKTAKFDKIKAPPKGDDKGKGKDDAE